MLIIKYPEPLFRIQGEKGSEQLFDAIRKKWVQLTPEEWVRQNFVQYLIQVKKYPASLIAIEKAIQLGELTKRFDILVYDTDHKPWMMVECKSTDVKLDQTVLEQVLRYNISVPVKYLLITNGNDHFGWIRTDSMLSLLDELPGHGT